MKLKNWSISTICSTGGTLLYIRAIIRKRGREYLENARTLMQTEPDRKRLRDLFGKPR